MRSMRASSGWRLLLALAWMTGMSVGVSAEEWTRLFNGENYDRWICSNGTPVASPIEDGALVPYESGGYLVMHERQFGDFILECDVKMDGPRCNSGVFLRVADPSSPVQTGFEIQISGRQGQGAKGFGAIYDLAPSTLGEFEPEAWNRLRVVANGSRIQSFVNDTLVSEINTEDFTESGKRPDGTPHKFGVIRDSARRGYLGFQDHGHKVWFRDIRIQEL